MPSGQMRGVITHMEHSGKVYHLQVQLRIKGGRYHYTISKDNMERMRILYSNPKEDIWVFKNLSRKLYNRNRIDRYNTILGTNLCFQDRPR